MRTVTVTSKLGRAVGRVMPNDDSPLAAANRAVRRLYKGYVGGGGRAYSWSLDGVDLKNDRPGARHYVATVVGHRIFDDRNQALKHLDGLVVGEARVLHQSSDEVFAVDGLSHIRKNVLPTKQCCLRRIGGEA